MEEQFKRTIKKMAKITAKAIWHFTKGFFITILVVIMIGAFVYSLFDFDSSHSSGSGGNGGSGGDYVDQEEEIDWSNIPDLIKRFIEEIEVKDRKIQTKESVQELWDKMLDHDNRIDTYIGSSEELLKMIRAQIITDYPNIDKANKKFDWDKLNKDVDSNEFQGIIKLKRILEDGSEVVLEYVDPETYNGYVEEYNKSKSEIAKLNALKHFTMEKEYVLLHPGGDYEIGTDGTARLINEGDSIRVPEGYDYGTTYTYIGWQLIGAGKQLELRKAAGMTFDAEGFGRINGRYAVAMTPKFGKVGDYIDYYYEDINGKENVIPCIMVDVKGSDAQNEWGHHGGKNMLEFYVNEETWCTPGWCKGVHPNYQDCGRASKMHENPGTATCHPEWIGHATKVVKGENYFDNPNFVDDKIEEKNEVEDSKEEEKQEDNKESDSENKDEQKMIYKYFVKIATFTDEKKNTIDNNGAVEENIIQESKMETIKVDYKNLVKGYEMPFDYLWTLLMLTKDPEFISELTDLVYESEVEISIYDRVVTTTKATKNSYTKYTKVDINNLEIRGKYGEKSVDENEKMFYPNFEPYEIVEPGKIVENKVEVKSYIVEPKLTKANVWHVDFEQKYKSEKEVNIDDQPAKKIEYNPIPYPERPNKFDDKDESLGAEDERIKVEDKLLKENKVAEAILEKFQNELYIVELITSEDPCNTKSTITCKETPNKKRKIKNDRDGKEKNFIIILGNHPKAQNSFNSGIEWFFAQLEKNENTIDLIEVTKELISIEDEDEIGIE